MISVIVPVFKTERYLERCVQSILNQTYRDIELILVDDGSPDKCPELCDKYALEDTRVRVIHKANGGVSAARNAGLEIASGDYITFVDSDDWIESDMYEKMMNIITQYDCDVVMCDCIKDFEEHSEVYSHDIRGGFYNIDQLREEYYPHLLIMENVEYPATISNCTMLWRRTLNVLDQRYQTGVRYSEDLLFGAKLMRKASSFFYLKGESLYHYMMNPFSASHTFVYDKWEDYQLLHNSIKREFERDREFDFSIQIYKCLLFFLYNTIGEIYSAPISECEKKKRIKKVLNDPAVRRMFTKLNVLALPISWKQKIVTVLYRMNFGISVLIHYYERHSNG